MEGAPPVANQIDLFMHFLGASRDGLVARRVDLDTISSSACRFHLHGYEDRCVGLERGRKGFFLGV
jgi:hypothetical protein